MKPTLCGSLYDYPKYYDLVFGSDWRAELAFLSNVFETHVPFAVRRLLEPACGTGRLLYRLAKRGYRVGGLDLNPKAVDYCNARCERHGLGRPAWVADMTSFRIGRPVDAAFNMINSFRHLLTEKDAYRHLEAMAKAVRPGGVYVLGLHLTPTRGEPLEGEAWSARRGHLAVTTRMKTIDRDLRRRRERFSMTVDIYTPRRHDRLEEIMVFRTYTARQMTDLIRRSRLWSIAAAYDFTYDIHSPITVGPETEDVVYVLRRENARP